MGSGELAATSPNLPVCHAQPNGPFRPVLRSAMPISLSPLAVAHHLEATVHSLPRLASPFDGEWNGIKANVFDGHSKSGTDVLSLEA